MDITCTPKNVKPLGHATVRRHTLIEAAAPGAAIYVASTGAAKADANNLAKSQARGIIQGGNVGADALPIGTRVDAIVHGPCAGFSGMTPGAAVYVSELVTGNLTHDKPTTPGDFVYCVGYAESATVLFWQPQMIVPTVIPAP